MVCYQSLNSNWFQSHKQMYPSVIKYMDNLKPETGKKLQNSLNNRSQRGIKIFDLNYFNPTVVYLIAVEQPGMTEHLFLINLRKV